MDKQIDVFELTGDISKKYEENVLPYELILDTIQLQNQQLQELQNQYIQLKNSVGQEEAKSEETDSWVKNRINQRIIQRKKYIEEILILNEPKYKAEFEQKKNQLSGEIECMEGQVKEENEGNINLFMNLDEGILHLLLQENRKNEEVVNRIKEWKEIYERLKKSD